jgi:class 3 adenylate cyclase
MAVSTVVFADLTGSTGMFEALGNAKATDTITRLTQWIGTVCTNHDGRVVKTLGDGVLAVFQRSVDALEAVVEMQRNHQLRIQRWPEPLRMKLKVGVATGEILLVDGDCYGDAVNVASRLSDLSGSEQIWATDTAIEQLPSGSSIHYRSLGPINIRGKTEARVIFKVEWQEEVQSDFLTMPAGLGMLNATRGPVTSGGIELSWLDVNATFTSEDMPIHLGRVSEAEFVVNDQRVSRIHAKIEWRNGTFVLVDVSSYGTWLRFSSSQTELALRRDECVLHGNGEIALGAPFSDFSVPTVTFQLSGKGAGG